MGEIERIPLVVDLRYGSIVYRRSFDHVEGTTAKSRRLVESNVSVKARVHFIEPMYARPGSKAPSTRGRNGSTESRFAGYRNLSGRM
jgi:hypothetical protein